MFHKPLQTRDAWYNAGRYLGDAFVWLSKKLKPERGTGNEDLDRVNNMYVDSVANQMTKEGIRELNEQTANWQRYDYFDPNHPTQGVYGGRYSYNPRHNQNLPSNSMASGIGDAFMRGLRHEDINGDFRFQDLQTGNIVQFTRANNPFTQRTAGKKLPTPLTPILPVTGGYRPSATFGVRRPIGYETASAGAYDPIAARAEAAIRAMSSHRTQSAVPQAPRYQAAVEPTIAQYAPLPQRPAYLNASEPVIHIETPGASYLRRKTTRPDLLGQFSSPGPIRRRPRSKAVEQAEPFDYVNYLSNLASLRYNF